MEPGRSKWPANSFLRRDMEMKKGLRSGIGGVGRVTAVLAAGVTGFAARAWAGGLVQPPQIDITNGTIGLDPNAGPTLNTQIQKWLAVVAVVAILGIGVNIAQHAHKMSKGDERERADGMKGIGHSILAIIVVAALWLIVSVVVGLV